MKILFTSDWHVDATTAGVSRFNEVAGYVDALVGACEEHRIDVVCFLGDAFDPGSMLEGVWSAFMIEAHARLTRAAVFGSVFIVGNHDVLDTSIPQSTLSPLRMATAMHRSSFGNRLAVVAEQPTVVSFGEVTILALPYVSRATIRSGYFDTAYKEAFARARNLRAGGSKVIAIGHYSLPGIVPGSEEEMMRGRDMIFPAADLKELGCALVVNGHYHARQTIEVEGVRVEVVGAPARFTFGERADGERGFIVAEV